MHDLVRKLRKPGSSTILFAQNFFKAPLMLGSVVPSSRFLVDDVLSKIDWQKARVLVEFGPGVGTITQEILKRMRSDAKLIVFELNEEFVDFLREEISDTRLHVAHASADKVREVLRSLQLEHADYIVSGIPYSTLTDSMRQEVIGESRRALGTDGVFLMYQFTNVALPYLKSNFRSVKHGFQFWNILPARIYYCTP
ncbi:MAG: methyltransferase [Acidobacteriaceae bacterium]|nr:methyltransferase [Acidobacteriaceae bacterium]